MSKIGRCCLIKLFERINNGQTYIIAEMSGNHAGSFEHALEIVHAGRSVKLLALRDMSVKRRKAGVELATELEVKYRREGRLFDEILKGD